MGYSEADEQLAKTYNDLADDVPAVRLKAAGTLLKLLSVSSSSQISLIEQAVTRLVKGLCSGRKAARLGFSIALSEALRLAFELAYNHGANELHLDAVTDKVGRLTQPEGKASGQEKREYLLGCRFAYQAILQSDIGLTSSLPDTDWRKFVDAIADLAKQKEWLRTESGAMLHEYLESATGKLLSSERVQDLLSTLHEHHLLKTPEGVALWLSIGSHWPAVLPRGVWHKKDPLSSDEALQLRKIMQGGSIAESEQPTNGKASKPGARQSQPSFAWKIVLSHLHQRKEKHFKRFWDEVVSNGFFASSTSAERKALGLQVVCLAMATAPVSQLRHVVSRSVIRTIITQRAESNRPLFEAAKLPLDQIAARVKREPVTAAELLDQLLAGGAFDQSTKTKTMEAILHYADGEALTHAVSVLRKLITHPAGENDNQAESRRRTFADMLLSVNRTQNDSRMLSEQDSNITPWIRELLGVLIEFGYCNLDNEPSPAITEATRSVFRARLMSCLGTLMQQSSSNALKATAFVVAELQACQKKLYKPLGKLAKLVLTASRKALEQLTKQGDAALQAYGLLFGLSMLQVYNEEPDSVETLQDLTVSFQAKKEGGESATMLVELLLSFVSKPSALFRKLAEQVFSASASELTSDSLQSLPDILEQKESLSGQHALFEQQGDEEGGPQQAEDDSEDEDVDGVDVQDMSDV